MSLKYKLAFFLTRSVIKPINGVIRDISEGEGGFIRRITDNSKDEADALERMYSGIQPTTKTLVKDTVSVMGLIESYEAGLAEMQDIVADMQGIVHSIDNVLQQFDTIDPNTRGVANRNGLSTELLEGTKAVSRF